MELKNSKLLPLTLLLLLMTPPPAESLIFSAIMTAVSFAYQAYQIINDAHDTYKKFAPQTTLDDVLDQAKKVEAKVDQVGAQLSAQINGAVVKIVTQIEDQANLREGLNTLSQGIRRIDNLYRLFELYTSKKISLSNYTLQDYIQQVTTVGPNSPRDILSEIHDVIFPNIGIRKSLIYYLLNDSPDNDTDICGNTVPTQGNLYQFFRLIIINEIRAFTMQSFAYSLNQAFRCESYKGEIDLADYYLRTRAEEYYDAFTEAADVMPNSIRACQPETGWVKGKNFENFRRFKTEYVTHEKAFFPFQECDVKCEDLPVPGTIRVCDESYGCNDKTECLGHLYNCETLQDPVQVCQLRNKDERYKYYIDNANHVWGNNSGGCDEEVLKLQEEYNCGVCRCICIEDQYNADSVRAVSFREQISDIDKNKVVTGIKFVVKHRMIQVQIQQGEALTEGKISKGTTAWKPLEYIDFDPTTTSIQRSLAYYLINEKGDYDLVELEDFLAFSWKSQRINLDDLIVPPGYVLTGVRFNTPVKDPDEENPLQLEIHASPFDFDSGKIVVTNDKPSIWVTPGDMGDVSKEYRREREKIEYTKVTNPQYAKGRYKPSSRANSYILLGTTDSDEDGGQTTVPFLDIQPVEGKPAFAAGGIGLFLKTVTPGDGGFLAFRLFGLESMKYIPMHSLDQLDKYAQNVEPFKGCNDNLSN